MDFISKIIPPEKLTEPALWFVFHQGQLLLNKNDLIQPIPLLMDLQDAGFISSAKNYLGVWQNQHCFCAEIDQLQNVPSEFVFEPLRQAATVLTQINEGLFNIAGRAIQILNWDKNHQFCGRCGEALQTKHNERAKICLSCDLTVYPRLSPVVMVLIKRGKEILLARSPHFPAGIYSVLAGFVEPGETVEQALEREVFEEVGLKIKNIRYRCSQPWPFPDSLMLGFTAVHAAGEIQIDGVEIEEAGWFTLDNLPPLPSTISISRRLIDLFITQKF